MRRSSRAERLGWAILVVVATASAGVGCYEHTILRELENCGWDGEPEPERLSVTVGGMNTCALSEAGAVRCWGYAAYPDRERCLGTLGYGNCRNIGDDETPASVGDVDMGGRVKQISADVYHTCAVLENGAVRCWGAGTSGRLGYGNSEIVGDDETPAEAGDVDVGAPVKQVSTGQHTCALLETGAVRCWGAGDSGQLGYGDSELDRVIGDDEAPASAGDVDVGGPVKQISVGLSHTCALLESGKVRCWGAGAHGQLGYGNTRNIGDDEAPASAGDVDVGGPVKQISVGAYHTCALLESGAVRCWGQGNDLPYFNICGWLGYGSCEDIGDDETPAEAGDVDVGGPVRQISAGEFRTCAVMESGAVRCWGWGKNGALGYGNTETIGDDETPASAGIVPLGCKAWKVSTYEANACAVLRNGAIRCWGAGEQNGYGNTETIGDDETPASAGDVPIW